MLRSVTAVVHLVSLVLGVACLLLRSAALARARETRDVRRLLYWDNWYGVVSLVWLGTGLYRAFGGLEKGTDYYLQNHVFWLKMLALLALLVVESVMMVTFVRWRVRLAKGDSIDLSVLPRFERLHFVEFWVIVVMVVAASTMARGIGFVPSKTGATFPAAQGSAVETLARGKELYGQQCSSCHQADGQGLGGRLAADFVNDRSRLAKSDADLLRSIGRGVPGTAMAGFDGRLDAAQQNAVLAYIRSTFGQGAP